MITIIGSGKVGGAAALFTALRKVTDEILLLDVVQGLPQGEVYGHKPHVGRKRN